MSCTSVICHDHVIHQCDLSRTCHAPVWPVTNMSCTSVTWHEPFMHQCDLSRTCHAATWKILHQMFDHDRTWTIHDWTVTNLISNWPIWSILHDQNHKLPKMISHKQAGHQTAYFVFVHTFCKISKQIKIIWKSKDDILHLMFFEAWCPTYMQAFQQV